MQGIHLSSFLHCTSWNGHNLNHTAIPIGHKLRLRVDRTKRMKPATPGGRGKRRYMFVPM